MELLEQLNTKVKKAVQKIETLQARVKELEELNAQNEAKLKEIMQQMDPLEETETPAFDSSTSSESSPAYRQPY